MASMTRAVNDVKRELQSMMPHAQAIPDKYTSFPLDVIGHNFPRGDCTQLIITMFSAAQVTGPDDEHDFMSDGMGAAESALGADQLFLVSSETLQDTV
eukprot:5457073-Amphidinium_carterae.1